MTPRSLPNILGYCFGWLFFIAHLTAICSYAVNIPYMDEWGGSSFARGNQTIEFNPSFIFGFHNEHRIVITRLEVWLMEHLIGVNFASLTIFHYILYILLCWWVIRTLEKKWQLPLSPLFIVLASTPAHENFLTAFQAQFHFAIGFFLLGTYFLFQRKYGWMSPLFIVISIFSMGLGVGLSLAYLLAVLYVAISFRERRIESLFFFVVVICGIALWFTGKLPDTIPNSIANIFTLAYWEFVSLLVIRGLGIDSSIPLIFGEFLTGIFFVCLAFFAANLLKTTEESSRNDATLFFPLFGLTIGILLIAYGRVKFGLEGALGSRYTEVFQLLLPFAVVLFCLTLRDRLPHGKLQNLSFFLSLCLVVPVMDNYEFSKTYRPTYKIRKNLVRCVRKYAQGKGDGICKIPVIAPLAAHIDYAKELKLSFLK